MLIDLIAGARPNFMKIAPIIRAMGAEPGLDYRLVHTGQHYDRRMSGDFFEQLEIPEPDVNLAVGSGTQAEQTGLIMRRYETLITERRPDACLVVGDVTSTMACAIVARKAGIPVGHVEAGIRSGDWAMPEEINRVVTDAITNWFFTTSRGAGENLLRAGADPSQVFFVGNTMIDTLLANRSRLRAPEVWQRLELQPGGYVVLTLHRPSNVDEASRLGAWLRACVTHAGGLPVIFPVHPRTARLLDEAGPPPAGLHCIEPLGYLEFNYLVQHSRAVITDSGGITEEATVLGVPCITLRDSTERPETVTIGTNELIGTDPAALGPWMQRALAGDWKQGAIPELWDGHAAERIVQVLAGLLHEPTGSAR